MNARQNENEGRTDELDAIALRIALTAILGKLNQRTENAADLRRMRSECQALAADALAASAPVPWDGSHEGFCAGLGVDPVLAKRLGDMAEDEGECRRCGCLMGLHESECDAPR